MSVYLWRYVENVQNYPGWNVAADSSGTKALREILARLANGSVPKGEISCEEPSQLVLSGPNNGKSPVLAAQELRLEAILDSCMPALLERDGVATFSISPAVAERLALALDDPPSAFDTALLDDPLVWYWGVVPTVG